MHQDTSQSVIYNLLAILSSGGHDRSPASPKNFLAPGSTIASDQISIHSSISGISRNEEQRRQIYENIVCTVTGVACILKFMRWNLKSFVQDYNQLGPGSIL